MVSVTFQGSPRFRAGADKQAKAEAVKKPFTLGEMPRSTVEFRPDTLEFATLKLKPKPNWMVIQLFHFLLKRHMKKTENVQEVIMDDSGTVEIRKALKDGKRVMIAPNHPGFGDFYLIPYLNKALGKPTTAIGQIGMFYAFAKNKLMARTVQPLMNFLFTRSGIFPVHQDAQDTGAANTAVNVIKAGKHPFMILPEGHYSWQNDRISYIEHGAASIGLKAASQLAAETKPGKTTPEVVIVPSAIRHRFIGSVLPNLDKTVTAMEQELEMPQAAKADAPSVENLTPRVKGLWLNVLNRIDAKYFPQTQSPTTDLAELGKRHLAVMEKLMASVESDLQLPHPAEKMLPSFRIKHIRQHVKQRYDKLSPAERTQFNTVHKPRLSAAYELHRFSPDYLDSDVSQERLAETLFKLKVLLAGGEPKLMAELGPRRFYLKPGKIISVSSYLPTYEKNRREAIGQLTADLKRGMEESLKSL